MTEEHIELIQLGSLLFLAAYHIILFFQVRRNHYLYLGLLGLMILIRASIVEDGSGYFFHIFPFINYLTVKKIEAFAMYAALYLAPMFFHDLYRFKSLKNYVRFFQVESILFIVVNPLVPYETMYSFTHNIYNVSAIGVFVFVFIVLYRAIKARMIGANYIFYGVGICFVFVLVEIIRKSGMTADFDVQGPNLVNTGVLILFFFQSISLSAIYAHSFKENEKLNLGLEQRVYTRTEQLSKSNLVKERLIKIISHDFRAPMVSLKSMLSLVESETLTYEQSVVLCKKIGINLDRSLNMLDDLLEWTKVSSESSVKIIKERADIKKIISETIPFFDYMALRKSIRLIFNHRKASILLVDSDINSVKVVLRNLINNAVKFTETGGRVEVGYKRKGRVIEVFVADNGIGIPDEMKSSIFDMESKNRRDGTDDEKSTGVGLALCKDLISQNGGKIWVQNNHPKGTVFKFTLDLSA